MLTVSAFVALSWLCLRFIHECSIITVKSEVKELTVACGWLPCGMRIVHFSDWHWEFSKLPEADLYVCSGDMYPDCPSIDKFGQRQKRIERIKQFSHANKLAANGGFKQYLGSPDAPVICVRGNHDYADLAPLFEGCNLVHEFIVNEVVEVAGLRVTGHRGIPHIYGGFADEMGRAELLDLARSMDDSCDLYLTHYPPAGVLDNEYGLGGILSWMEYKTKKSNVLHCMGHIHEEGGQTLQHGHVLFSNAATTYNLLEGSPEEGWKNVSPL